jgi:hypothetical protein
MALLRLLLALGRKPAYGAPGTVDLLTHWVAGQLFIDGQNPFDFQNVH